ncbi:MULTISPECIES: helix-turn-helix domain-containing protein [unclassified Lysinibacillus]|uniref:helix-turn-helix domain-containing protein n=1 Tax=unclassified Lysinibacillus TaxID=2636778 RepID=UPI0030FACC0E
MNKAKTRGKYTEWLTKEGLLKIEGWARNGLTDEQIAHNMGISRSTLNEWKRKYSDISDTLKRGKEVVDIMVENSLLKRALGYEYLERKFAQVEMAAEEHYVRKQIAVNQYKLDHPEATLEEIKLVEMSVSKFKSVLVEEKTKEVAPDVTAQIFWLKNRKPDDWRDKQQNEITGAGGGPVDVLFNIPRPPKKGEKG